uniref:Uncharacterized protein n=1 Tax=Anguilla anguilla TaxID=7936 RepID=A0A0E9S5E0_ANGAN
MSVCARAYMAMLRWLGGFNRAPCHCENCSVKSYKRANYHLNTHSSRIQSIQYNTIQNSIFNPINKKQSLNCQILLY